jgi:hypothetical protein
VRAVHEDCAHEVRVELRCEHCEREVDHHELRATPGAGLVRPPAEHDPGYVSGRRLYSAEDGIPLDG